MKLTNREALAAYKGLKELLYQSMPCKLGYTVQKNLRILQDIVDPYEQERIRLVNQYGEKDEAGGLRSDEQGHAVFTERNSSDFLAAVNELLAIENEVNALTAPIELFDGLHLTAANMMAIDFMIA